MAQEIRLDLVGRVDKSENQNEYFFTRPNLPCMIDLSQCVLFVHPYRKPDGEFGAELVIKKYRKPDDRGQDK